MYYRVHLTYSEPTNITGGHMKYFLSILLLSVTLQAQNFKVTRFALPNAPRKHSFFTTENKVNFSILAGLIAADAVTTQRALSKGYREGNPLMRPFVTRGAAGEAAGSALGLGAGVGVAYLLHHSHHYKAERITMRFIIAGEGACVANNMIAIR